MREYVRALSSSKPSFSEAVGGRSGYLGKDGVVSYFFEHNVYKYAADAADPAPANGQRIFDFSELPLPTKVGANKFVPAYKAWNIFLSGPSRRYDWGTFNTMINRRFYSYVNGDYKISDERGLGTLVDLQGEKLDFSIRDIDVKDVLVRADGSAELDIVLSPSIPISKVVGEFQEPLLSVTQAYVGWYYPEGYISGDSWKTYASTFLKIQIDDEGNIQQTQVTGFGAPTPSNRFPRGRPSLFLVELALHGLRVQFETLDPEITWNASGKIKEGTILISQSEHLRLGATLYPKGTVVRVTQNGMLEVMNKKEIHNPTLQKNPFVYHKGHEKEDAYRPRLEVATDICKLLGQTRALSFEYSSHWWDSLKKAPRMLEVWDWRNHAGFELVKETRPKQEKWSLNLSLPKIYTYSSVMCI